MSHWARYFSPRARRRHQRIAARVAARMVEVTDHVNRAIPSNAQGVTLGNSSAIGQNFVDGQGNLVVSTPLVPTGEFTIKHGTRERSILVVPQFTDHQAYKRRKKRRKAAPKPVPNVAEKVTRNKRKAKKPWSNATTECPPSYFED